MAVKTTWEWGHMFLERNGHPWHTETELCRAGPWLEDFQRSVLETSEDGENESQSKEGRTWWSIEVYLRHRVSMPREVQAESTSLHHSPFPFCFFFPESHGQVSRWLLFFDTIPRLANLEGKTFLRSRRSEEDGERAFLLKDCWMLGCLASRPGIGRRWDWQRLLTTTLLREQNTVHWWLFLKGCHQPN